MHRVSYILLLLLFLYSCSFLCAQTTQKDSIRDYFGQIEKLIEQKDRYPEEFLNSSYLLAKNETAEGAEKVAILLRLYTSQIYRSPDLASSYNEEALALATELSLKKGIFAANYNRAYLKFMKGNFEAPLQMAAEVQQMADYRAYPETHADFTSLKSVIHSEKGEYDLALETALELLDEAEKSKNEYMMMRAYSALSHYYLRVENFSRALSYCLKGLHYIIKLKKTHFLYPKVDEIARMTAKLDNREKALEVYAFYIGMEKKIPAAGSYIQSVVYMNMADIFMYNGEYKKAQRYLSRALDMNYANNYRFRIPRALILQAELFLKQGDTVHAIENYERSVTAAENIEAYDVVKGNSAILSELYGKMNDTLKAYEYQMIYKAISDSLFTNEKEQKIIILETKRDIKEVSQRREILELENKAHAQRFNTILIILLLLIFISLLSAFSYIKVKGKNKLLSHRTIELAEVYWIMSEKLRVLQKSDGDQDENVTDKEDSNGNNTDKKDSKTPPLIMDEDVKDIILAKLEKLESELFFIDPNCNLYQLSDRLKTNPKYLSQVINQTKNLNFKNYLNELRINFLLTKLLKDVEFRNSKLSYIAVSVGYNNLNTFNTAFKKRHGILPSYFIKELNSRTKPVVQLQD